MRDKIYIQTDMAVRPGSQRMLKYAYESTDSMNVTLEGNSEWKLSALVIKNINWFKKYDDSTND